MSQEEVNSVKGEGCWRWFWSSESNQWIYTFITDEVSETEGSNYSLDITPHEGGVQINNQDLETLNLALNDPETLAIIAKQRYFAKFGVALEITDGALAQEIYWHACLYNQNILTGNTAVSNCGETDRERWIWYFLNALGQAGGYLGH